MEQREHYRAKAYSPTVQAAKGLGSISSGSLAHQNRKARIYLSLTRSPDEEIDLSPLIPVSESAVGARRSQSV